MWRIMRQQDAVDLDGRGETFEGGIPEMMKTCTWIIAIVTLSFSLGCANRPAQAPVPGAINSFDSWAFRIVDDSDASVHAAKIWYQCTATPAPTVSVDGKDEKCNISHPFPMEYKGELNLAITALNTAKAAGAAYHSGASKDTQGMTDAVNRLSVAVAALLSHIGGQK
jgi:hypothetical protein